MTGMLCWKAEMTSGATLPTAAAREMIRRELSRRHPHTSGATTSTAIVAPSIIR